MKIFHSSSLLLLTLLCSFTFRHDSSNVQSCFTKGTVLKYSTYDKNNILQATEECEVTKVLVRNDTVFSEVKGKWKRAGSRRVFLKDARYYEKTKTGFISDVRNLIPSNLKYDAIRNIVITGNPMIYPFSAEPGKTFADDSALIRYEWKDSSSIAYYHITNRKILRSDSISTPAGKFNALIFSYDESIRPPGLKSTAPDRVRSVIEWFNPQLGIVKAQYFLNGKIDQEKVLVEVK